MDTKKNVLKVLIVVLLIIAALIMFILYKKSGVDLKELKVNKIDLGGATVMHTIVEDADDIETIINVIKENKGTRKPLTVLDGYAYDIKIYTDEKEYNVTISNGRIFVDGKGYTLSEKQFENIDKVLKPILEENPTNREEEK